MRPIFLLLALVLLLPPAALFAEDASARLTATARNVVYARAGKLDLKLDVYLPPAASPGHLAPPPVVIYIHGGGWRIGNKDEGRPYAESFTRAGIALVSIDHRTSGQAIWPAQIYDAKAAVRWVRANARQYGLDPTRIGIMGASSGGHLAALLGTTAGVAALEDPTEGNPKESTRVQAVCDISGPIDMNIPTDRLIGKLAVRGEFGGSAAEKPDLVKQADPSRYVHGGEPPFLLIYGAKDGLVTPAHAFKLQKALQAHHDDVTLDLVPGAGHVPMSGQAQRNEVVAFFGKHLGTDRSRR